MTDKMHAYRKWGFICVVIATLFTAVITQESEVRRRFSNVCDNDSQCPDNAFCRPSDGSGYCACKNDYIMHLYNSTHRECLKEAKKLGDPCRESVQCNSRLSLNAECVAGQCRCKSDSHFAEERCYKTSIIGQSCSVSANCYIGEDDVSYREAYCVRGTCECTLLHRPRDGGTRCLKDAVLGDECEDNDHCTGENTRCEDVCRCLENHVVHPDEMRCVKIASYVNEECEIEAQCTDKLNGTTCIDRKCVCQWDHHYLGGKCWSTRNVGQRCTHDQQCKLENGDQGQCDDGICKCNGCPEENASAMLKTAPASIIFLVFIVFLLSKQQVT